jgi:tetratricopeptide (TPR) repeat protein
MKLNFNYILILLMLMYSAASFAQQTDSLFNKAKYYYENEEYHLAIPYFTKCLALNPDFYTYYQLRGNCLLEVGQNAEAIADYKSALNLKKASDLYFNLGNAYERINNADSAIYYFRVYTELEPNLANGFVRLCILYMYSRVDKGDSAIYFASQAVKADPKNPANLNFLAMSYYSAEKYKSSLETALMGLAIDSSFSPLNQTAGISSVFMGDYSAAINYFDRAFRNSASDYTLLDFKIQAMLLQNTDPSEISILEGQRVSFRNLSSETMNTIDALVSDASGEYSYKNLSKKIQTSPLSMSMDEFFMLYIGYTQQTGYSPYKKPVAESIKENDPAKEAFQLEEMLVKNPVDFPVYLNLADLYLEMGNNQKYFENRYKYFGFTEGIKASGNGLTPETAIIINDVSHEYNIMLSLGYRIKSKASLKQKKHEFDVLTGTAQDDKDTDIYFNTDKPVGSLSRKAKN